MAITPTEGYMIDPNNPNGVVKIGSVNQQTGTPYGQTPTAPTVSPYQQTQQPIAQAPPTPTSLQPTPSAPVATPSPQQSPVTVNVGTATSQQTGTQAKPLTMPATGSVVDLLNGAGADSSYTARTQLAQQYGIQNYTGTAAQNQELSKKYIEAHNALKSTAAPQNAAEARNALTTYQDTKQETPQANPTQQFMDVYGSMNPIEANVYQQLSGLLSATNTKQTLTDLFKQEATAQGIPELNMQLADVKKIMDGTEDDIRSEIQNAGGFATESQVQAMVGARNKTLLKQASYLSDVLSAKNDYVDNIVSLTQADRKQVSDDLDRKLGITNTLVSMSQNMEKNAKDNYQTIVDSVGWDGLAKTLQGNPTQTANVEKMFGLAPGELQTLSTTKKPLTAMEQAQLTGQQLQNQKLQADLKAGPTAPTVSTNLQNFGTSDNPHYKLINSKTGAVISDYGSSVPTGGNELQMANQQQTINDTQALLDNSYLKQAVGPNFLARAVDWTGQKSNFIAGIQQLTQQLTLDQLQNAKKNGATFGALSEGELSLVNQSATKLNSWAIKDKAGNVTGYNVDEADFKKELSKINNFQKLDFVLKSGDPASVGLQQQSDGSYWSKNSDGTYTKIQ